MISSRAKTAVLMVDDNPANLLALEAGLGGQGYQLISAGSGPEALAFTQSRDFAVILLDVQMPIMDGFQTAQRLRSNERSRYTPIIFLTANYPSEEYVLQGYEAGAVDYLIKPLNMGVLRSKVAVFVDVFRKSIEIREQAEYIAELRKRETLKVKQDSERRYQDLVDGIRDGIVWAADLQMQRFSFVSHYARRISGHPVEVWRDQDYFWETHIHPDDKQRVARAFEEIRSSGEPFVLEHRFLRPNGETLWFHTGVHVDGIDGDASAELRGLSVDITHLKDTENALRDAVRARDEFLSIASHELRTPITPLQLQMQGFMRLMDLGKWDLASPEKLREMIEISDSQVSRLARLISQLLDVSRINAGRIRLEKEVANLSEIIRGVSDQLYYEIQAAECAMTFRLDPAIQLKVDKLRMEQVVVNLLTNALKYGAGKPVEIDLFRHRDRVWLTIRDQGIGIAPKDQQRIFEQFERAVSAQHYGGLGLGLYISAQIVELHGGKISVESELEKGAKFIVDLPLVE